MVHTLQISSIDKHRRTYEVKKDATQKRFFGSVYMGEGVMKYSIDLNISANASKPEIYDDLEMSADRKFLTVSDTTYAEIHEVFLRRKKARELYRSVKLEPLTNGASEKQISYANNVRMEIYPEIIESYCTGNFGDLDDETFINALVNLNDASAWLDMKKMTREGAVRAIAEAYANQNAS